MGPIPQATPQRSNGPDTAMDADANTHGLTETPLRKFFEAAVRFQASDLLLRGEGRRPPTPAAEAHRAPRRWTGSRPSGTRRSLPESPAVDKTLPFQLPRIVKSA